MRIIFAGTPEVAVPGLRQLIASKDHEVVGVLTRTDAPVGRKRVLTPSPVALAAEEHSIPTLKTNRLDSESVSWIQHLDAELGVVVAYGALLKQDALQAIENGWINVHFSDLPRWRGAAPVQRALMAGETEIGVSIFRLVEELDAGPLLNLVKKAFPHGTTAGEVLTTLAQESEDQLLEAIEMIAKNPDAGVTQVGEESYAHKLTREDGKLDFTATSLETMSRFAGVTPEPGAWAYDAEKVIKIHELEIFLAADQPELSPGQVIFHEGQPLIGTAVGALALKRVQPAGKQSMPAADWLRGKNGKAVLS